jgi:hypothetical protein
MVSSVPTLRRLDEKGTVAVSGMVEERGLANVDRRSRENLGREIWPS